MSGEKPKKRRGCSGCLLIFLIVIVVIAAVGVGVWKFGFKRNSDQIAKQIINGPVDPEATKAVTQALTVNILPGAQAVVAPLPGGEKGNVTIISLDPANGFKPADGTEGKRQQALNTIKSIVTTNKEKNLNLQRAGVTYMEGGKPVISVTASMSTLEAAAAGQLTEEQFLAKMDAKVEGLAGLNTVLSKYGMKIESLSISPK
jgi:hypothetical protein